MTARTIALWTSSGAFAVLTLASLGLFVGVLSLTDGNVPILASPTQWLHDLDPETASGILFNAADVVAGVLAIAITVSAIVVELAATRYNHRITWLFVREPINIGVMSLFVVTTLLCIWIAAAHDPGARADVPRAAFVLAMVLVSASLLVLLPYFAFVFAFLSPLSIIDKIKRTAYRAIRAADQRRAAEAVDELHDVARGAVEQSDRGIAMACVDALADLVTQYSDVKGALPASWFDLRRNVTADPDFISLAKVALDEIDQDRLWLEVKVFRQYLSLLTQCVPDTRDVANLVAIDTGRIGTHAHTRQPALRSLAIRSFNSYLRATINAKDPRTSYYVLNQYRLLAEELVRDRARERVAEVARHFRFYGQLAHKAGQSFLLEVAAHDIVTLIEVALPIDPAMTDDLLGVLLELDQEIRSETQEESLLGVRRAQMQLATLFLVGGDDGRAQRIANDLRGEKRERLERIRGGLETETRPMFWEIDDRGVNFGYLSEERRAKLVTLFHWLD